MQSVNVLLVDDNFANLLAMEAVLSDFDANLIKANSGESALKYVLEQDFAVILLDVQMKGMDGFETIKLIKQRKRSALIPIIFLTGIETGHDQIFQGYKLGAADYLLKPIIPEVLHAKVSVFIDLFRKTQQIEAVNEELRQQLQRVANLTVDVATQERLNQERAASLTIVEQARERMSFLSEASAILAGSLDYETTLSTVARLVVPKLADWCSVHILQEDGSVKQVAVQHVDPAKISWAYQLQERYPEEPNEDRGLYHVLKSGEPELYRDVPDNLLVAAAKDEEHLRILREIGFSSAMTVPLMIRGQVMGAIAFAIAEGQQHYDEEALQFAQELAYHCALAVENARLYRYAHQQQEHLRVTLTSIGDALITTDANGNITLMNRVAETLTGWVSVEAMGRELSQIFNIVNETSLEPVESPVTKVLRDGTIAGLANHTMLIAKDGRQTPIDDSGAPIRDPLGNIIGVVLVFRDISERKQAENALTESEQRFRMMADTAPVLIWLSDTDMVRDYFNKRWLGFTGRTIQQEMGNGWTEGIHPDDLQGCLDTYLTSVKARQPFDMEYRLKHISDEYRWITDEGTPRFTPDGNFAGYIGSCVDIHDRKKNEIALKQALEFHRRLEEKLTLLIESSSEMLQSLERSSVLQAVLEFSSQIVGADAYALWQLLPTSTDWQIIAASGLSETYQHQVLTSDEKIVPFEAPIVIEDLEAENVLQVRNGSYQQEGLRALLSVPLHIHGRVSGAIVFYHRQPHPYDELEIRIATAYANIVAAAIGSAELYQEAQHAIATRDEFLSVAAHELKTPITSLRGFAQMFTRQIDKTGTLNLEQVQRTLLMINEQSAKLAHLVTQLLDISRIQSGKLILEYQPTDITGLLRDVIEQIEFNPAKHIITIQPASSLIVNVDPLRLEQVFTNLIDNAVKYSPSGGPVMINSALSNEGTVTVMIEDRGIGIPPEHRPFILGRFYQAHVQEHLGGLGLGLYISKQILELHGGSIEFLFPPEGGTCVKIELPIRL